LIIFERSQDKINFNIQSLKSIKTEKIKNKVKMSTEKATKVEDFSKLIDSPQILSKKFNL
jgi:hypothetical protein